MVKLEGDGVGSAWLISLLSASFNTGFNYQSIKCGGLWYLFFASTLGVFFLFFCTCIYVHKLLSVGVLFPSYSGSIILLFCLSNKINFSELV